jgi:hypothetical protein
MSWAGTNQVTGYKLKNLCGIAASFIKDLLNPTSGGIAVLSPFSGRTAKNIFLFLHDSFTF